MLVFDASHHQPPASAPANSSNAIIINRPNKLITRRTRINVTKCDGRLGDNNDVDDDVRNDARSLDVFDDHSEFSTQRLYTYVEMFSAVFVYAYMRLNGLNES